MGGIYKSACIQTHTHTHGTLSMVNNRTLILLDSTTGKPDEK